MDKSSLKNPSEVTALFIDHGLFISQALRLAQTFKKVYCYTPWETAFPKMTSMIGYGYDELEIVDSIFGPHFDEIDIFVFPDINHGPLQQYLVDQGKVVWGSRLGECLELDREGMKDILKALDLPVGKYEHIKGIDNLRSYLKEKKNVYVKINKWRGTFETFHSKNYLMVEPKLDEIEYKIGPLKHIIEFTVEEQIEEPNMFEGGTDGFVIDGEYPSQLMSGLEIKDLAYVGIFTKYAEIPEPIRRFNDRMKKVFKAYGYRGWMSTEVRIGKDHEPYMIDGCMRSPSPPNELWQELYSNFAEIVWYGANGIVVDPEPKAKYGAEVLIHSSWASGNWQPVDIDPEVRQWVKLRNAMKINGREYISPMGDGLPEIGAVIGLSDKSIEDAIKVAIKHCDGVSGYYLEMPTAATDKAIATIEKMDRLGLNYFN